MSDVSSRQSSPKSSPRGSRSPAYPRQDSTGTLKTTITLGKKPSIFQGGTFYLMKEPPEPSEQTGLTNLMQHYMLEHSYHKFTSKKVKDELSAFLPHLPGNIDTPGSQDNSSLRSLIEKPPIGGRELIPLSGHALAGFRLHAGPVAEQYLRMHQPAQKRHKKHKKERKETTVLETQADNTSDSGHDHRKPKKAKRTDEERKKRKKEKKKKKEKEKEDKTVFSQMLT